MVAITATNSATPSKPLQRTDAPCGRPGRTPKPPRPKPRCSASRPIRPSWNQACGTCPAAARLQEVEGLYSRPRMRNARTAPPPSIQDYIVSQYNASISERQASGCRPRRPGPTQTLVRNPQGQPTGASSIWWPARPASRPRPGRRRVARRGEPMRTSRHGVMPSLHNP